MTKWPSAKHFASWLGLSPNNRITGGRVISSKTKACANRAAAALRLAANALHRSDSALGAAARKPIWEQAIIACVITPCCGTQEYVDLAPNITKVSGGRCARPSVGRPNWATSLPMPMVSQDTRLLNPAAAAV